MRKKLAAILLFAAFLSQGPASTDLLKRIEIAKSFYDTRDFNEAASEYRRGALFSDKREDKAALLLLAADAYREEGDWLRMGMMLDDAEELEVENTSAAFPYQWLRMAQEEGGKQWASAAVWGESAIEAATGNDVAEYLTRGVIADYLLAANISEAIDLADGTGNSALSEKVSNYAKGKDKSPFIGGLLGIIPGMGYAYSGEYGNMLRSLLLNGIFGWAMIATAEDEEWAVFSVATFFELTWYTGSIYGGIDAAHRYNKNRLDETLRDIRGPSAPVLRTKAIAPILELRLGF